MWHELETPMHVFLRFSYTCNNFQRTHMGMSNIKDIGPTLLANVCHVNGHFDFNEDCSDW